MRDISAGSTSGRPATRRLVAIAIALAVVATAQFVGGTGGLPRVVKAAAQPAVTAVTPTDGPVDGDITVYILGTDFTGATQVRFGALNAASFAVDSDNQIRATPPNFRITAGGPGPGVVDVKVTGPGGTSTANPTDQFTFRPVIFSVSPSSGLITGGNTVTLTGEGFRYNDGTLHSASQVCFGTTCATPTVTADGSLTVTAPAHTPGTVTVKVTTHSVDSADNGASSQYTYTTTPPASPPTVTSVDVQCCVAGKTVHITGTNYMGNVHVYFGFSSCPNSQTQVSATFSIDVTGTMITATAPDHVAAAAASDDIVVTNDNGNSGCTPGTDGYTYNVPNLTMLTPTTGQSQGGTSVKIDGSIGSDAFNADPRPGVDKFNGRVKFGNLVACGPCPTQNSGASIVVNSPPHAAGPVSVQAFNSAGASNTKTFSYFAFKPIVSSVAPKSGPTTGGQTVILTGQNFTAATTVTFDTTDVSCPQANICTVDSDTKITVVTPNHAAGTIDVKVTTGGGTSDPTHDDTGCPNGTPCAHYTYVLPPPPAVGVVSQQQYTLPNSNGTTWVEIDPANLEITQSPGQSVWTLLTANTDLWTKQAGFNQDIGIFVSDNMGADTLLGWKESGGFAGTFSPNAAYLQTAYQMVGGHNYVFKLKWKTNINAPGVTILAGAGPINGQYSPTSLTAKVFGPGVVPTFAASTSQYTLAGSDGSTWTEMDTTNLRATVGPLTADATGVLGANVDLWTTDAGVNQDIAIFASDNSGPFTLVAWKESGGFAGTFSPNAAFVKATYPMVAGHSYQFELQWKSNVNAPGKTIKAGAGPINGFYSPTSLSIEMVPAGTNPYSATLSASQPSLVNSDGVTWQGMDSSLNVTVPAAIDGKVIVSANADLWTNTAGFNQDIGIFVSIDGVDNPNPVAWKESGGFAGTFSPNAAMVQVLYQMTAGHNYRFTIMWKTNVNASGATIKSGAGPLQDGSYSPTRITAELSS